MHKSKLEVTPAALVRGGGLSGMTCSLELANQGFEVHLIEKEDQLGGNLRKIYYTINGSDPDDDKIQYLVNWSDSTNETISAYLNNSTAFNTSHNWSTGGVYVIKVYSVDENNASSDVQQFKVLK